MGWWAQLQQNNERGCKTSEKKIDLSGFKNGSSCPYSIATTKCGTDQKYESNGKLSKE